MIQISSNIRGYKTAGQCDAAIHQLARAGFNYFVPYHDTQSRYALMYGVANWVEPGNVYVDGGYRGSPHKRHPHCPRPWVANPYQGLSRFQR